MAQQDTTVKAFVGLPIEDLICQPIIGAAKGQAELAKVTLDFVNDLAFTGKENEDGSKQANIINVNLDRLTNSSTTGEVTSVTQTVQMPMMALVNTPNFAMDTMEVDFSMEVKQSMTDTSTSSSASSSEASGSVTAKASWGFGSVKATGSYKSTGSVSASKTNTRSSDFSAKYHVNATAKQLPPAEGMAKFTQILASVIEPINTSSEVGNAE
tara:strand:- start:958 stop:1593 length:636 start_codon:yes stop_codon:yes gene_type:complete